MQLLYLTSVGEKTTKLAHWQAERLGFKVVLLNKRETWIEKYKRFILSANEACFRCDADIILNKKIASVSCCMEDMIQYQTYDLYRNDVGITSPVYYSKKALDYIRDHLDDLDEYRPETSAWRMIEKAGLLTYTDETVVGFHGFYQSKPTIKRAKQNKIDRKQIYSYDFRLAEKINEDLR